MDAPDLPPEECEFFITSAGVADTEKAEVSKTRSLDFEVETLFEDEEEIQEGENTNTADNSEEFALIDVKGIGDGTAKNLTKNGISSVEDLLNSDPENLATKISGISSKMITEWQTNAKALLSA